MFFYRIIISFPTLEKCILRFQTLCRYYITFWYIPTVILYTYLYIILTIYNNTCLVTRNLFSLHRITQLIIK